MPKINVAENHKTVSVFWEYNPANIYPSFQLSYSSDGTLFTVFATDIPNQPSYYDKYVYYTFLRDSVGIPRINRFYLKLTGLGSTMVDLDVKLIPEEGGEISSTIDRDTPSAGSQLWGFDSNSDVWRKLKVNSTGDDDGTGYLVLGVDSVTGPAGATGPPGISTGSIIGSLDDLSDVTVSGVTCGQILLYDCNTNQWVNSDSNITGGAGETGTQGDTGAEGIDGSQGDTGIQGETGASVLASSDTSEPTGFVDRTTSTIAYSDAESTFYIHPKPPATEYSYWLKGEKYFRGDTGAVTVGPELDTYFIYYDDTNTLRSTTTSWLFENSVLVALIYKGLVDGVTGSIGLEEERHGIVMDWQTHEYLHNTTGTRYYTGFGISGYALNTDTPSAVTLDLTGGILYDEDIREEITRPYASSINFSQNLADPAQLPVYYRVGTTGNWYKSTATDYFVRGADTGLTYYNDDSWGLTEAPNGDYVAYWIIAVPTLEEPVFSIMGQRVDDSLEDAQNNNTIASLQFGDLAFQEFRILYRVIIRTANGYATPYKFIISDVTDYRTAGDAGSAAAITSSHNSLAGREIYPAHPADALSISATGAISSTNVEGAIFELTQDLGITGAQGETGAEGSFLYGPYTGIEMMSPTGAVWLFYVQDDGSLGTTGPLY